MRNRGFLCSLLLTAAGLSGIARATDFNSPSSLLIFAEYRTGPGHQTLITVTNTNASESVAAHFVYINGQSCLEFDRSRILTAKDTLTVSVAFDNPASTQGYVYVYAENIITGAPISWDFLTGSQIEFDANPVGPGRFTTFAARPFGYKAGPSLAVGSLTDLNHDGLRNLDGLEYEASPADFSLPLFFGQDPTNSIVSNLILINLSDGLNYVVTADLLVYDDSEHVFSANMTFFCWTRRPLASINPAFNQSFLATTSDASSTVAGFPSSLETGWMEIHAPTAAPNLQGLPVITNPAILVVLDQQIGAISESDTPYFTGTLNDGRL